MIDIKSQFLFKLISSFVTLKPFYSNLFKIQFESHIQIVLLKFICNYLNLTVVFHIRIWQILL